MPPIKLSIIVSYDVDMGYMSGKTNGFKILEPIGQIIDGLAASATVVVTTTSTEEKENDPDPVVAAAIIVITATIKETAIVTASAAA